jgi:mRNA interferase MazF
MSERFPKRGEVYFAELEPVFGREQGGHRPVLVIQNDVFNQHSPVIIVASITSAAPKGDYPTDVVIQPALGGRSGLSRIQLNQLRTIDKRRLGRFLDRLSEAQMARVDEALKISLSLVPIKSRQRSD